MEVLIDIKDILEIDRHLYPFITKGAIFGPEKKIKKVPTNGTPKISKRPEGMAREVFALLYNDKKDAPPLLPTDTGYKNNKANLSMKNARAWKWMPFTNPARCDNAVFHHWRRVSDEGKEYPFARFNKKIQIPSFSESEYAFYLASDTWTRAETEHLFDLCKRFDLRFGIMADRWDQARFGKRTIEDLKERYYGVCNSLAKIRCGNGLHPEMKHYYFDAEHERKRKDQLGKLYSRTKEQIEEEQLLQYELRKIEARKKERDKKTQDLQKLITAADCQIGDVKKPGRIPKRRLAPTSRPNKTETMVTRILVINGEISNIKFPDLKGSGVYLRSQKMKLPANIGQKKIKAIEQLLVEMNIANPTPTKEICQHFNELRCDLLLLHELRTAMASCEFELQSLRHQYEASNPGKTLVIPPVLCSSVEHANGPVHNGISDSAFLTNHTDIVPYNHRNHISPHHPIILTNNNKNHHIHTVKHNHIQSPIYRNQCHQPNKFEIIDVVGCPLSITL